jgi:preprotein translocase subunit SecA
MAGRGVDILLGGNPEGLAQESVRAEGLELASEEGIARFNELFAKYKEECGAEGDQVRELGGLYVLGSERHEARRVDDQLRGRSGRQGDPGESRFFLSLEDELMRLFAQGMMQWAMGRFPEDIPIENRMVTRAIERAQHNVEIRNAEVRKDVLKYDEVMNEQRKVIYAAPHPGHGGRGPAPAHHRRDHVGPRLDDPGALPVRLPRGMGPGRPVDRGPAVLPHPAERGDAEGAWLARTPSTKPS